MRPVVSASEATRRLLVIFPRTAFDTVMSSPLAGAAVAALIYVDAVAATNLPETFWARPSMVTWMSEDMRARGSEEDRRDWRTAASKKKRNLDELLTSWAVDSATGYADNSRETLRDETFRKWRENGAVRENQALSKNSGNGRWALEPHFADLFHPDLDDTALVMAAASWREAHLSPAAKLRVQFAEQEQHASHGVRVVLPGNGGTRSLEAGRASLILKTVIERWAVLRLANPFVVTISEPGDKLYLADAQLLRYLNLSINVSDLLPDALIADIGSDRVQFWFVEAVNTEGEINEERKKKLLAWASSQGINPADCEFLTAFSSRNDGAARRRLKDLAVGTFAYFADEPARELAWSAIDAPSSEG